MSVGPVCVYVIHNGVYSVVSDGELLWLGRFDRFTVHSSYGKLIIFLQLILLSISLCGVKIDCTPTHMVVPGPVQPYCADSV